MIGSEGPVWLNFSQSYIPPRLLQPGTRTTSRQRSTILDTLRALLSKALAGQIDAVGVVNKAVQDCIGVSRIADHAVPMIYRKLACHKSGAAAIAFLEDFEKVLPGLVVQGRKAEVVEDEKVGSAELPQ